MMKTLFFVLTFAAISPHATAQAIRDSQLVFSGKSTLIVVSGYSTSSLWPKILQRKLDRYYGGKRVVEVKAAVVSGTPIAKLIELKTGRPRDPFTVVGRALATRGSRPAIVLAQQSLQGAFGPRKGGIRGATDIPRIRRGARIIGLYVDTLHNHGADYVIMSTHLYKREMEPEIGNERYALEAYLRTEASGFSAGPNTWSKTRANFPAAYAADKIHLSRFGAEIVAQEWFADLLKKDGLPVPTWSVQELHQAEISAGRAKQGLFQNRENIDP